MTHICWHVDTQFVERQQVMIFVSCFNDPCSTLGFGAWRESLCYVNYVSSPKQKCALVGPNIQLYPKQKHYNDKKLIFPTALFHSFPTVALFWQRARGSQTCQIAATCDDEFQTLSTVSAVHCSQRAVQILLESPHIPACGGSEGKFLKRAVSLLRPQFKQSRESSKRWADTMMGGGPKMVM